MHALPKLKRQLHLHHQNDVEILTKNEGAQPVPRKPGEDPQGPALPSPYSALLRSHAGFNCVLCTQTLGRKEDLLLHWAQQHNCEDPPRLWRILDALSNQGMCEPPTKLQSEALG